MASAATSARRRSPPNRAAIGIRSLGRRCGEGRGWRACDRQGHGSFGSYAPESALEAGLISAGATCACSARCRHPVWPISTQAIGACARHRHQRVAQSTSRQRLQVLLGQGREARRRHRTCDRGRAGGSTATVEPARLGRAARVNDADERYSVSLRSRCPRASGSMGCASCWIARTAPPTNWRRGCSLYGRVGHRHRRDSARPEHQPRRRFDRTRRVAGGSDRERPISASRSMVMVIACCSSMPGRIARRRRPVASRSRFIGGATVVCAVRWSAR